LGLNFTGMNPAHPVLSGFVTDASGAGIAGVTGELSTVARHLFATATTSASGSYGFRCTAPGTSTVQVVSPSGDTAQPPVTLDVTMFDEVRVDFTLQPTVTTRVEGCRLGGAPLRAPRCCRARRAVITA